MTNFLVLEQAVLSFAPKHFSGAFRSQAHNIKKSSCIQHRENACFLAAVSSYLYGKFEESKSYPHVSQLIADYNELAPKFGVKALAKTKLTEVQNRVLELKLVNKHNGVKNRKHRRWFTFDASNIINLLSMFRGAMNLAKAMALSWYLDREGLDIDVSSKDICLESVAQDRIANRHREIQPEDTQANAGAACEKCLQNEKRAINLDVPKGNKNKYKNSNSSSNLKKLWFQDNGRPRPEFFKANFGRDYNLVYKLQEAARAKCLNAKGAILLMSLHRKHCVPLGESFERAMKFIIWNERYNPNKQPVRYTTERKISRHRESSPVSITETLPNSLEQGEEWIQQVLSMSI